MNYVLDKYPNPFSSDIYLRDLSHEGIFMPEIWQRKATEAYRRIMLFTMASDPNVWT